MVNEEQLPTMGLTVAEVARHLHYNPATIRRWAREGKIPCLMLGSRKMIFSRRVIDQILADGRMVDPDRK